jgi:BASS family bile acid:Na+ symporter
MAFLDVLPTMLLAALALVMLGLGLSLRIDDFTRVLGHPAALALALGLQLIILPLVCLAIVVFFGLQPAYAVGLLLLAASPGGVSANLFSHVFGGNVAMNVSLTAITTVLSIVSLPLVANLAIALFAPMGPDATLVVPLQFAKVLQVVAIVLIPVVIGMTVAARWPAFATRAEKPFKIVSVAVLASFAIIAIVHERQSLVASLDSLGPAVLLFNLVSLGSGYYLARAAGLDKAIATAISYEIGIHNSTLAIYIALSVLGSVAIGLPAAIYSIAMYITGALFGFLVLRRRGPAGGPG